MNRIGRRKQLLGIGLLVLLVVGIGCIYITLFLHLCCSPTSGPYHLPDLLDCGLLPSTAALEVSFLVLFGLILLFFLPLTCPIPHLSEFIDSLFKPPRLATYFS